MNTNTKIFLTVFACILVVTGGLIFFSNRQKQANLSGSQSSGDVAGANTTDENKDPAYLEKLAKYMSDKGMVMYGAYWCPHCQDQKKAFGDAFQYVDYVECDPQGPNANPDECTAKGIDGYPTWIYQDQKYSGFKSLSDLAGIVGFSDSTSSAVSSQ